MAVLRILDLKPTWYRRHVVDAVRPLRHDPLEILATHFGEEIPATPADVIGVKCYTQAARNERPKNFLSLDECHLPYVATIHGVPCGATRSPANVQEQLGLELDAQRGPAEVLVVDSAAKPEPD